jgi:ribosomal protein L22
MARAFAGTHISRNQFSTNNGDLREKGPYGPWDHNNGAGLPTGGSYSTGNNNNAHTQERMGGNWSGPQENYGWEPNKQQQGQPNRGRRKGKGGTIGHNRRVFIGPNTGQTSQQSHQGLATNQWEMTQGNMDEWRKRQGSTEGEGPPQKTKLARYLQMEFPNIGHRLLEKIRMLDATAQQAAENSPEWRNFYTIMSLLSEDMGNAKAGDRRFITGFPTWVWDMDPSGVKGKEGQRCTVDRRKQMAGKALLESISSSFNNSCEIVSLMWDGSLEDARKLLQNQGERERRGGIAKRQLEITPAVPVKGGEGTTLNDKASPFTPNTTEQQQQQQQLQQQQQQQHQQHQQSLTSGILNSSRFLKTL